MNATDIYEVRVTESYDWLGVRIERRSQEWLPTFWLGVAGWMEMAFDLKGKNTKFCFGYRNCRGHVCRWKTAVDRVLGWEASTFPVKNEARVLCRTGVKGDRWKNGVKGHLLFFSCLYQAACWVASQSLLKRQHAAVIKNKNSGVWLPWFKSSLTVHW